LTIPLNISLAAEPSMATNVTSALSGSGSDSGAFPTMNVPFKARQSFAYDVFKLNASSAPVMQRRNVFDVICMRDEPLNV
jgi:hypothetical protein